VDDSELESLTKWYCLLGQYHLVKRWTEDVDLWWGVVSDADMMCAFYVIAVLLMALDYPRI
jgi:hypothetical protein